MRKYTLVFMEQRIGTPRLTPVRGADGEASFEAADDDAAIAHACKHYAERVRTCSRAELSSMAIVADKSGAARLVDDSLENPHFQECYIRYDARSRDLQVDFVSTATSILPGLYRRQSG